MRIYCSLLFLAPLFWSCSNQTLNATDTVVSSNDTLALLTKISSTDSLLFIAYNDTENNSLIPVELLEKAIELNKQFANQYPTHPFAAEALDKTHQLYTQLGNYHFSTEYGMLLINQYPNYAKINLVMYSVATSYDFILGQQEKAIPLYETLLQKNISENTRNEIIARLKQVKK